LIALAHFLGQPFDGFSNDQEQSLQSHHRNPILSEHLKSLSRAQGFYLLGSVLDLGERDTRIMLRHRWEAFRFQ
jgi:hypothetical protein